jgi:hypothetical protein
MVHPINGAIVRTTAGSSTSAADGSFTIVAVASDRTVVHVEAAVLAEAFPVARSRQLIAVDINLVILWASQQVGTLNFTPF